MKAADLHGVWRLLGITSRGSKVHSQQTHLVVLEHLLWEVWPNSKYYEGEPGPEHEYRFQEGEPGRLQVVVPNGRYCYLATREGERLLMRLGGVFGRFPKSIDDDYGNLYTFEREKEEAAAALRQPPARIGRRTTQHAALGAFVYDDNLHWWEGRVEFGGQAITLNASAAPESSPEATVESAARIFHRLNCEALRAYASSKLLELYNDTWREAGEGGPPVDAATFGERLTPESIVLESDGEVSVWFLDDDMFGGHSVRVSLDADLQPTDARIEG